MKGVVIFAILGLSAALSNRGLLGQTPITDHSCVDHCGEQHSSGHCYCQSDCVSFNDCCDDFTDVCPDDAYGSSNGSSNAEIFSCQGQCHGQHKSGQCWCDEACTNSGDCCTDVTEVCFDLNNFDWNKGPPYPPSDDDITVGSDDDITIGSYDDMWTFDESWNFVNFVSDLGSFGSFGSFEASSFEVPSFDGSDHGFPSGDGSDDDDDAASSFGSFSSFAGSFLEMENVAAEAQMLRIREQPSNAKVISMVSGGAVVGLIAAVALMAYKRTKATATPATPAAMGIDL